MNAGVYRKVEFSLEMKGRIWRGVGCGSYSVSFYVVLKGGPL